MKYKAITIGKQVCFLHYIRVRLTSTISPVLFSVSFIIICRKTLFEYLKALYYPNRQIN